MGPGPEGFGPYHEAAMELCDGVDLLIHDAQYTASELPFRLHFGHSAADYAVGLGRACGARACCCSTTIRTAPMPRWPRSNGRCALGDDIVAVDAAREGETICLGEARTGHA